ncbi:MAG: ABC transporter ATP-binding protein [Thermoplasmata archaeon]|nr:ABC transporter ATP-binding protein [Thermoplasmata archaeon]MBR4244584.1 ABC transporter ATP-binding protein [Candidatus Methanomethylophilaceae archaeon]
MTGAPRLHGGYYRGVVISDNPKSTREAWSTIFRYLYRFRALFILAMVMIAVESILTAVVPEFIGAMTDIISDGLYDGNIDLAAVTSNGLIALSLYGIATLAMYLRQYWMTGIAQNVARKMRSDLQIKLDRLPMSFFDNCKKGDVMSRFINDTDTIGTSLARGLPIFTHGILIFIVLVVVMLIMDVTLAVVSMVSCGAGMLVATVVVGRTQKYYRNQQKNIGRMYGLISELYTTHDVVLAYSASEKNKGKFDQINEELRASGFRSEVTMGLLPAIMKFFGNLGYVAVCIVGSIMVIEGHMTIGMVVSFIFYVKLFSGPLDMISHSLGNIQAAGAGAERIADFLSLGEMSPEIEVSKLEEVKGRVEFRNVHFGYVEGAETIKGFSATVEPGQKVAIVGETGAGKTTTVNLLMRFYEVSDGEILIDGTPISEMSRKDLRDMFCMVLQDTWLFEGTIRENIAYCRDVSDEDVKEACRKVGLEMFIESLPDGLDTHIGAKTSLSEGQRQQICIARALVDDSPMLILDEATSSVDTRTEVIIQNAIDSMMAGRTCFVIAHRLSTVRNADVILVMKDGNIVEKGTHDELLGRGGVYADLYRSQFESSE